jgi:NAD(P)-dependent dehydrogenase (short-subunit alcohol dehydrogenase family)
MTGKTTIAGWTLDRAPRLEGKVAIVTGATGGLGYETALGLARLGATTILAGRNPEKGRQALTRLRGEVPGAVARFEHLDLASLASVATFADAICAAGEPIDILVNNAAVMGLPTRRLTEDGFEQQIGVNYLGHFALTARLKDVVCAAPGGGRVVNVASLAHRRGALGLDDFQSERGYSPMGVYRRSKLAMLVFAIELERRAVRRQWNLRAVAAHPGWSRTDIIPNGIGEGAPGLRAWLAALIFNALAQPARDGALPELFAAVAPQAEGGAYYGPTGWGETRGAPGSSWVAPQAKDAAAASELWTLSETVTGVGFG